MQVARGGLVELIPAYRPAQLEAVRELFREYSDWLEVNLHFQDFERELATLPGSYAPPDGRLLLARVEDQVAGCIALRNLGGRVCELKRLWVRPAWRRHGVGRALTARIVSEAQQIGYERMRLDTLRRMVPATTLYKSIGFREIEAYRHNPLPDVQYLELELAAVAAGDAGGA